MNYSSDEVTTANIEQGEPVTAPGVTKNYPDAQKLVTEDCIGPKQFPISEAVNAETSLTLRETEVASQT